MSANMDILPLNIEKIEFGKWNALVQLLYLHFTFAAFSS